jgi:hypothetical protein
MENALSNFAYIGILALYIILISLVIRLIVKEKKNQ